MVRRISFAALALAAGVTACDRPAPTAHTEEQSPPTPHGTASQHAIERGAMDRLARRLARAMADPALRADLKAALDRSPFAEHKVHLQRLLQGENRRLLKAVARLSSSSEEAVDQDTRESISLEVYLPVPAHRAEWTGGDNILVASARTDHEAPVAYDVRGRRHVLSPKQPPGTPVLALVPVETDFDNPFGTPANATCTPETCSGGGGTSPPAGLYMTYSHFVQDFEGWFKGDPEFEIHILGQAGATDSLRDYQCSGANAGGYYRFDQNDLDWRGSVLLFSQAQLNNYKSAHPNQNFRIIALEDDDTSCQIKFDDDRFRNMIVTLQTEYPNVTGAKDTTSGIVKWVKRANALQKILSAAYSFITTQDDMIGNAVEDVVAGQFFTGANWVVKGESNKTNGWLKLEMR
jgi:hypothetical protein